MSKPGVAGGAFFRCECEGHGIYVHKESYGSGGVVEQIVIEFYEREIGDVWPLKYRLQKAWRVLRGKRNQLAYQEEVLHPEDAEALAEHILNLTDPLRGGD